ncbi:diguanylate cyclase domain-containing protein [Anabaena sp. 4-3]|uniref:diguanylate cyclase domain-containing protein n=1 Tax=Anabaena sp. 4-3 TaxID=1811979 RepID=UPI00082B0779|nr:diguanylate cyclase [Anabaena sp. 4-3]
MPGDCSLSSETYLVQLLNQITSVSLQIHQGANVDEVLNTTVEETRKILACDRVLIYQILPDGDGVIISESLGRDDITPVMGQLIYDPCFAEKWIEPYRQGRVQVINDIYTSQLQTCHIELLQHFQVRANLVVPILLRHESTPHLWGLLIAQQCIHPRRWHSLEIELLRHLGMQLGIALEHTQQQQHLQHLVTYREQEITEQKAALETYKQIEKELRWQKALLRSMTDTSPLAFYVVDNRTDNILYFNHRFCEIWGIEHLEHQMQRDLLKNNDIIPYCVSLIADVPAFAESCKPLQSEENRCIVEDEILFTDGRMIRRFSSQIRDVHDQYFGRLYIFEDITLRKQTEAALKASEERWQFALEGNGDGVWDWNAETGEIFFSRRWKEMLGFAEDEIDSNLSAWEQLLHPDDKTRVYQEIQKHFRGETQQYVSEYRVRCQNGTYKWILDRGKIVTYTNKGVPLRLIGTHTDITERKWMEEALRESEARYRSVITTMAEGIVLQQADGQIITCNQSAERIMGLTPDQMMGRALIDSRWRAIHEDGSPFPGEDYPAIVTLRTGKPQFNVVMGVHQPDGNLVWISINSQPLFYLQQSQPYAAVVSFTDITMQKQAEKALKRQVRRERTIHAIAQNIRQSLDLEQILNTTVAEVRQFLQTDRVVIYRFNANWSGVVITESVASEFLAIREMEFTDSYFVETQGGTYHQGQVNVVSDIDKANFTPCHLELLQKLQVRAKLVVPILQQQQTWGLLIAHHCSAPRQWQPFDIELLTQLATQLAIAIQQSELHEQLQIANQHLQNLALIDQLTQLANRRCFDQHLNHEWHHHTCKQRPLSLILCDIDYFKQYNDTYGHSAGDVCLQSVAQALKQAARQSNDLVARYGGEEFALILPDTDSDGAIAVAQFVQEAIQKRQIPHAASAVASWVTVSIGIATVIPTPNMVALDLINAADQALYQAKARGRNNYYIYNGVINL